MKYRKINWWKLSALAAAMTLPGAGVAASLSADFFSAKGWVEPGEEYPFTISYDAEGSLDAGTITVTLPPEATFDRASIDPASQNGQTVTFDLAPAHGAGRIIIWADAADLNADPTIIWKNLSASVTYSVGSESITESTLGPKVTTLESARYGKRPFPLVMVEYQDIHHCTGNNERGGVSPDPFQECAANHSAEALDEAVNSRTSGRSLWQLYQDMSFGQLSPEGQVGPNPGTPDTLYDPTYNYKWSTLQPSGTCTGTTTAPPSGKGAPLTTAPRIVNGWYRLPGTQGYYGSDTTGHAAAGSLTGVGLLFGIDDACGPTAKITYDAAAIADPELDYNEFDTDKDGVVDFFNVAFAGEGGNGNLGTGANNVWPHKSDLQYYFTDENGEQGYVSNDQLKSHTGEPMYWTSLARNEMTTVPNSMPVWVRVGPYNVNPEAAIEKMSVIAHEYGHSLGLPDFYSTGSRSTFGSWELMASDHSQFMTVFNRQEMGWIVPREAQDGSYTLTESKTDTGTIHWKKPNGTPYVLTGPGIHNADALKFPLPTIKLIDYVPSGVRAWHSGSGNDFGCPTTQGHNLDFFVPDLAQHAGSTVELSFQSLYEIEWDWDYAFLMVSDDGGVNWTALPSQEGTTMDGYNPNNAGCFTDLNNGISGSSREAASERNSLANPNRYTGDLQEAQWITDRYDLSDYAGKQIIIRFGYFTDPAVANRGWFIDDINLTVDGDSIYSSDFEEDEHTRIFPDNWTRVSTADGVEADHAYYVEVRDRVSWDFNGKNQSERGDPNWQPGVAVLYTDESHGYGNTGVDNPPAQTIVDSQPTPGDNTPNLDDAAYTGAPGRDDFNACVHIDNYSTPGGDWDLPGGARVVVDSITGLYSGGDAENAVSGASADITVTANAQCDLNVAGPMLSIGSGYEDPDTNGSYELTWVATEGANGPNQLQEATSLGLLLGDDAENDMSNWTVSSEPGTEPQSALVVPWDVQDGTGNDGSRAFYTNVPETNGPDAARSISSIMTWHQPIAIPANGATTLSFYDQTVGEADDVGLVEVRDVNDPDAKWEEVYSISNPIYIEEAPPSLPPVQALGHRQVDLTPFFGKTIELRFRYFVGAASSIWYAPYGWWVDDIRIDTANWEDIASTTDTSFTRSGLDSGHYYYRVRSSHVAGAASVLTNWSNIVETDVNRSGNNSAPLAVNDTASTNKGMPVTIDVLANDSDPDNDNLNVVGVTQGSNGTVTNNNDGTVTYTPASNFVGEDSFTYTVNDGQGGMDEGTVTVMVSGNTAPEANDDSASTEAGTAVTIDVLSNDSDPDGDPLTISNIGDAGNGSASDNGDGTVTYTPAAGFAGTDQFSYSITDGKGGDATATVTVEVDPRDNVDPKARDDEAATVEGQPIAIEVLLNDSDDDGDTLRVSAVTQGNKGGTVGINANEQTVTYIPASGFTGTETFEYTVDDGFGGTDTAKVTVEVTARDGNTPPEAKKDKAKTPKNMEIVIYVLSNDKDKDGDMLTVVDVTAPAHGSAVINADNTVTYTPATDYVGEDEFTYTIHDGHGGYDTEIVEVKVSKKDRDDDGSSDDQSSADDGSDDHSSDDGSSRDDGCSKDADCDGDTDSKDDDDDNDGIPDEQDDDIDGDGIPNSQDSKGHDNVQGQSAAAPMFGSVSFPLEVNASTASILVETKGMGSELLQMQILDSAGLPVGVSVTSLGELTTFAQTFLIGTYTVTITNPTSADIDFEYTTVRQQF
ncbi:MAG: cadherin-like domain-containing protein [Gammaproteobacteria bacterium]|nr:cadherin-like domain-containing protein [Gammaproteobacteria bacterium]